MATNENQDVLDLCRLNLMEDNIKEHGVDPATQNTLKLIDLEKRIRMTRLKNNPAPIADGALEEHIRANSLDGVYPWTDAESVQVYTETEEEMIAEERRESKCQKKSTK